MGQGGGGGKSAKLDKQIKQLTLPRLIREGGSKTLIHNKWIICLFLNPSLRQTKTHRRPLSDGVLLVLVFCISHIKCYICCEKEGKMVFFGAVNCNRLSFQAYLSNNLKVIDQ